MECVGTVHTECRLRSCNAKRRHLKRARQCTIERRPWRRHLGRHSAREPLRAQRGRRGQGRSVRDPARRLGTVLRARRRPARSQRRRRAVPHARVRRYGAPERRPAPCLHDPRSPLMGARRRPWRGVERRARACRRRLGGAPRRVRGGQPGKVRGRRAPVRGAGRGRVRAAAQGRAGPGAACVWCGPGWAVLQVPPCACSAPSGGCVNERVSGLHGRGRVGAQECLDAWTYRGPLDVRRRDAYARPRMRLQQGAACTAHVLIGLREGRLPPAPLAALAPACAAATNKLHSMRTTNTGYRAEHGSSRHSALRADQQVTSVCGRLQPAHRERALRASRPYVRRLHAAPRLANPGARCHQRCRRPHVLPKSSQRARLRSWRMCQEPPPARRAPQAPPARAAAAARPLSGNPGPGPPRRRPRCPPRPARGPSRQPPRRARGPQRHAPTPAPAAPPPPARPARAAQQTRGA